jgi:hypothetical protein
MLRGQAKTDYQREYMRRRRRAGLATAKPPWRPPRRLEQFEKLKAAEESERDIITRLAGKIARKRLRSRRWRG